MSSDPRSPESPAVSAAAGPGAGPVRTCVGCRGLGPRSALLRVVARAGTPVVLVVDTARALPGRGAWLHPHGDCLDAAERRRAFARALRVAGPVDVTAVREHLGA